MLPTLASFFIPSVIDKTEKSERAYDIFSRLLKDRVIFLFGEVNDAVSELIVAQMLFLEAEDPNKDIFFYINSPGGVVTSGLAIYDTMQYITPDVCTLCLGQCCSMGAFLLSGGAKCLPPVIKAPCANCSGREPYFLSDSYSGTI